MHPTWTPADLAALIAALPASSPLPSRVVIVPNARVSHSLRRELLTLHRPDALVGTRFLTLPIFAQSLLQAAGEQVSAGESSLRAMRLRLLFDEELHLEHFPAHLLRTKRGWDWAIARTLGELEEADLRPADLLRAGPLTAGPLTADLAKLWRRANAATSHQTWPQIMARAADHVTLRPELASYDAALAIVTTRTSAIAARLLQALPRCELAFLAARPLRQSHLQRYEALFGAEAALALALAEPPRAPKKATERDLLAAHFYQPPDPNHVRPAPKPTKKPPTVRLEEHAGVEEELEAAAQWVAEQIVEHQTPLEDIAVLVPHRDPWLTMVRDRLQQLSKTTPDDDATPLPVFVAGGIPAHSAAAGARVLTLLRALAGYLNPDGLAAILPLLRTGDDQPRIAKGAALDLAYSLGTVGGSPGNPRGALDWSPRVAARIQSLTTQLATLEQADELEQAGLARDRRHTERQLAELRSLALAIDALSAVAEPLVRGASLATLWSAVRDFIDRWLVVPPGPKIEILLDSALAEATQDASFASLSGPEALDIVEQVLGALRLSTGRFGDPAVYVGTISSAVGLRFTATRILGLAEGSVPSHPREDAVLPDALRAVLSPALATNAHRTLASIHDLDTVLRFTTERIALSAPRYTLERGYREPAPVFIEAATALGLQTPAGPIDLPTLRRAALRPARLAAQAFADACPIGEPAWQQRACSLRELPQRWFAEPHLDLDRIDALLRTPVTAMDGIFPAGTPAPSLPGLSQDRPISASRLRTLLACPHQFLVDSIFYWSGPSEPRPQRELDALAYGSLFHNVAEAFYEQYGAPFAAKKNAVDHYKKLAAPIIEAAFDDFLDQYPLAGDYVREQQLQRLTTDFETYLESEWDERPKRRFVASEQSFGEPRAVALRVGKHKLWVRGRIDLLEVQDKTTVVRDIKTGKVKPRGGKIAGPTPTIDAQLGLYAAVTKKLASEWGVPDRIEVAYVHTNDQEGRERAFADDYADLEAATQGWLETAVALLQDSAFPRTPNADDCGYCSFKPLCGLGAQTRAVSLLADAEEKSALALLWEMKQS